MRQRILLLSNPHEFGWADLRLALRAMETICVVGEATDAHRALDLATARTPDVIIAATKLAGKSTLPLLMGLPGKLAAMPKILFFASYLDPAELAALDWRHVAGYLLWDDLSPELLPYCLTLAVRGATVLQTRKVAAYIRLECRTLDPERRVQLTEREQAVLRRLAEGLTHEQIARVEPLSLRTVARTVAVLEAKLDAPSQFVLGFKTAQLRLLC